MTDAVDDTDATDNADAIDATTDAIAAADVTVATDASDAAADTNVASDANGSNDAADAAGAANAAETADADDAADRAAEAASSGDPFRPRVQLLEEKFQPEQGLEPGLAKERAVLPGEGRRVHPAAKKRDKTYQAKTKKKKSEPNSIFFSNRKESKL